MMNPIRMEQVVMCSERSGKCDWDSSRTRSAQSQAVRHALIITKLSYPTANSWTNRNHKSSVQIPSVSVFSHWREPATRCGMYVGREAVVWNTYSCVSISTSGNLVIRIASDVHNLRSPASPAMYASSGITSTVLGIVTDQPGAWMPCSRSDQ